MLRLYEGGYVNDEHFTYGTPKRWTKHSEIFLADRVRLNKFNEFNSTWCCRQTHPIRMSSS